MLFKGFKTASRIKTLKLFTMLVCAFIFANVICYFYHNIPKQISNQNGYTTFKYQAQRPHFFYGTEGYGITTIDENGFNNDGCVQPKDAKIICIGSSQTRAFSINTAQNYVSKLNELDADFKAYNLGVSAQFLNKSLFRLPLIPQHFSSCKVIVVETPSLPSLKEIDEIIKIMQSNTVPIINFGWKEYHPISNVYYSLPLITLMYAQANLISEKDKSVDCLTAEEQEDLKQYGEKFGYALQLLRQKLKDMPLVFLYLPQLQMEKNGHITIITDTKEALIKKLCAKHKIKFINMGTIFHDEYVKKRVLPYGFRNTSIGKGHLNVNGHKLVAQELATIIHQEGWLK